MALGKLKLLRPLYLLYLPFVFWNPRKLYSEHPSRSFKPLVLERFKIWIAQFFPKPEELNRDTAPRPAINDGKRLLPVSIPGESKFVAPFILVIASWMWSYFTLRFGAGLITGGDEAKQ